MKIEKNKFSLQHEEKRALKIYLILFYIILILYDLLYYYIYPLLSSYKELGFYSPIGYINYIFWMGLIPITFILIKKDHQSIVKYIFFLTYTILYLIKDIIDFKDIPEYYSSGNAVEIILVLFSPIFINKRYFWVVSIGTTLRYIMVGIIIHASNVLMAVVINIFLSIIAYIFLHFFILYLNALNKSHEELRHKEKLAFIGQIASSIGHEIRNPLASLKGFTQLQREKYPDDDTHYSIMEQEIERIDSILNDVLLIGKPRTIHFENRNLNEIVEYVKSVVQENASYHNITFSTKLDQNLPMIECEENQIKQVLLNLVKNGIESMDFNGEITIQTKRLPEHKVMISIYDQGCGIEPNKLEMLGEPFYTTKSDGTGLGLMVTKKIIEDHQGTIQFISELSKGTEAKVILPFHQN